ncbi:MAG: biotin transporter BioY [Simkaniaceae bacterium]|nr:biotin transporter BioY [Simkaniaceae bacterium]
MKTLNLVYIALFAALMAALGVAPLFMVPLIGVPITAQSMGVMLAGGVLGSKRGALSMTLFLTMVAIGLPLLPGGRGGFVVFAGPSAGFLVSWILGAYMTGWLLENSRWHPFLCCLFGGIVCVYAIGIPWVAFSASISLWNAFAGSLVFLIGDTLKALIATSIIVTVKRYKLVSPA